MAGVIDHIDIRVSDLARSRGFYEAALGPLGLRVLYEHGAESPTGPTIGFGRAVGEDCFAIHEPIDGVGQDLVTRGAHFAFAAANADEVRAFHRAALAAGGRDIGGPGPRPEYSDRYFGGFVLDPDDNNVEAVWHAAEPLT